MSGTRFLPAVPYTVKLEGVKLTGFRTISIAGIGDPILISQLDSVLDTVSAQVKESLRGAGTLLFHTYGGPESPAAKSFGAASSQQVGLVMEVIAHDQDTANTICSYVRSTLLHFGYPGRISTAGNLALLYSPSDIQCGPVYEFSIYHLMDVDDPKSLFPIRVSEVNA